MVEGRKGNVYIFGADGMLGRYLTAFLGFENEYDEVIGIGRRKFEVGRTGLRQLDAIFKDWKIDDSAIVINAIGLVPQAVQSGDAFQDYFLINGVFPHYLAFACSRVGAHMFHISTDCVFSGIKDPSAPGPYLETSKCCETKPYGLSKSMGEPYAENCSVVRCSLIGEEIHHSRSLLQWVLSEANRSPALDGYTNHFWNGLTCLQLARILNQVIKSGSFWSGVRHFYSPSRISKFELLSIIAEEYGLECEVRPVSRELRLDKCLGSSHNLNEVMQVPAIRDQIRSLKDFQLIKK